MHETLSFVNKQPLSLFVDHMSRINLDCLRFNFSAMESEILTVMDPSVIIMILIPLLLIALFLTSLLLLWYSGYFIEIDVKTCKSPLKELEVAYKFVKGSYKDSSLVYAEAHSLIPHLRCIGIYYDNPKEVCMSTEQLMFYFLFQVVYDLQYGVS